ncbi:HECT E3 ubiquitin ligase [Phytophthora palmivora]|uniref:HECT-type E3 ubiquitin transferase n=1 Tax=Phytophthora palmivora TaxID=4796 RepID=A0A2P4Y0H5_9STRA|nr:HECT E3 ubiquitin ligase [Phytophthora palmivora]
MSARRSLSDASDDDDEFLNAAFDELEEQDGGFFEDASSASTPRRSSRRSNAARMLEALEALAHEAEGEGGVPQSLRGLLQQLHSADGSILGGMLPFSQLLSAGNAPRFQRMLEQIGAEQPIHTQMTGLSELCETLSLSTEEALAVSGFSVDSFVPAIVTLIRLPPSMDVLLLAARALSTVLELYPTAIQKATAEHVIPSLCEKLLEIEYMDVAELALQILEKIVCKAESALTASAVPNVAQLCAQYRMEVIQENGIVALLQFLDFFPLEIQRRAARIVCQLCTDFSLTMEGKLRQGLPYITNLMRSLDSEILQSSFACLQKLGESTAFSENSEFASMIATEEICGLLLNKLTSYASLDGAGSSPSSQLSPTGYTSMLRFLSCLLSCVPSDLSAVSVIPSASHLRFVKLPPIVTALLAKQEVISENQLLRETLKLVIVVLPIEEELSSVEAIPRPMLTLAHEILPLVIRVYDVTSRADLSVEHADSSECDLHEIHSTSARLIREYLGDESSIDDISDGAEFVKSLLRCLQDAISSEKDVFSVSATDGFSTGSGLSSGSVATDLEQLTQHIKVHVLIEETKPAAEPDNEDQNTHAESHGEEESEESALRWTKKASSKQNGNNYKLNMRAVHDTVVLVEPLARIETMEDFIADKLFGRGGIAESIVDEVANADDDREEGGEVDESGEFANDVVKPRRVVAVYKGQVLPTDISVLEAIVKFGVAETNEKIDAEHPVSGSRSSPAPRSRIWTASPHDVMFRVAASSESSFDDAGISSETTSKGSKISAAFSASTGPSVVRGKWWDDVWDLLLLLKLVRQQCLIFKCGVPCSSLFVW